MSTSLENILRDTLAACERLLTLARGGDDASEDTASRMLFGRMRDAAYELRKMATRHLAVDAETDDADATHLRIVETLREAAGADPAVERTPVVADRSVLIVDDDDDLLTSLREWFQDRGFSARTALDGAEALAKVNAERPDLITLDIRMPGRSGIEILRELKADPDFGAIPVIVITGSTDELAEGIAVAGDARPEAVLAKPFELYDLATLVKRLVA